VLGFFVRFLFLCVLVLLPVVFLIFLKINFIVFRLNDKNVMGAYITQFCLS